MVELFEQQAANIDRHSSKGNQLKWRDGDTWYKADYMGYEGLAEYVISQLLRKTSLRPEEYVLYELQEIGYRDTRFHGVSSANFLKEGEQLITLERLFKTQRNESLYKRVWEFTGIEERLVFLVRQIETLTSIRDFGPYMAKLLTIDAVFLNEDRHFHNIAVIMDEFGRFRLCPIFDQGGALLSDTRMDYPLTADVYQLLDKTHAKTISRDFDEQLDAAEKLYGETIHFDFTTKDVDELLDGISLYPKEDVERVRTIIHERMRKYAYLFS